MKRLICMLAVAFALAAVLPGAARAQAQGPAGDAAEGAALYEQYCANCHGADLKGGMASSLVDGIWQFGRDNSYLTRSIYDGIPDRGMPAYGGVLSQAQVGGLVAYIRQLETASGGTAAPRLRTIPPVLGTMDYGLKVEKIAEGVQAPWAIDFLDATTALVTEKAGRLRVVENGKLRPEPVEGAPAVMSQGQGGMLDVTVDPQYATNKWIYLSFSHGLAEGRGAPAMTKIVRGKLDGNKWTSEETLFEAPHDSYLPTTQHFGNRIVFDPQGFLFFSIGERGRQEMAQDVTKPNGKVHRINSDGSIPQDNPFFNTPNAIKSIWSFGHRNPQGLAVHPVTGQVWDVEHGPRGGDEVNLVKKGANYGWPVITYGINYNGQPVSSEQQHEGMEQPAWHWRPSIAVGGCDFYTGDMFPAWKNKLLVTALNFEEVQLLDVVGDNVIHSELLIKGLGRVREAVDAPDGSIYVVLNTPDAVIRLSKLEK